MKYIDLFAGVGGFRYGIERAFNEMELRGCGQEKSTLETSLSNTISQPQLGQHPDCVYSNEWDKYANSVYKKHYGECDSRDIREVPAEELPDFDLLCGGFPCQAFSIAGKRGGFEDTRGTLFFEIARIVKQKQPRLLLLENVKGLLSHDKGRTFATIISTLDELGYDVQWQVLNSKNFGVPQNRERVFIVGHLRGTCRPEVFPITESNGQAGSIVRRIAHNDTFRRYNQTYEKTGSTEALDTSGGGGHQPCIPEGMNIRRLTPVECERLQGFPDDWTKYDADRKEVSDTQRYKMMGNAVTTNVITEIVKKIL